MYCYTDSLETSDGVGPFIYCNDFKRSITRKAPIKFRTFIYAKIFLRQPGNCKTLIYFLIAMLLYNYLVRRQLHPTQSMELIDIGQEAFSVTETLHNVREQWWIPKKKISSRVY